MASARLDLDGNPIKPLSICMIGAGGFIGSHLCEKILAETPHKILAVDVYNDKIKHLLEPESSSWAGRIEFHRINIKHDSRLEGLIKMADLVNPIPQFRRICKFCDLDLIHTVLNEIVFGGQVLETSSTEVMKAVEEIARLEKASNAISLVPKSVSAWQSR